MTERPADPPSSDPVEDLIAELLVLDDASRPARLLELCTQHPAHAATLRRRIAVLNQAGLVGGTRDEPFPDLLGEFKLLRRIGGGGMGVVYAALQQSLSRTVALKLIRPEHLYFERARERFRREVEAVARLQHPAIVPIYTVGEAEGVPYFAMELVHGCSLADALHALSGRDPAKLDGEALGAAIAAVAGEPDQDAARFAGSWLDACLRVTIAVAEALEHAHERGVLHRDVKPSNVLLAAEGRVLLADFGLAVADGAHHLTRSGTMLGSLPYMPPEQIRGTRHVDARADVYALGVTLYEMLTLEPQFAGEDSEALRSRILAGAPERISAKNRRVPEDVELVWRCATDPDPRRRYATMHAFADDLGRVLERRPIAARRPSAWLRARRWVERNRVAATVVAALVLGSTGFAAQQWLLRARILEQERNARVEATTARRVTQFLLDLFDSGNPARSHGASTTVREVIDRGAVRIRGELDEEPRVRAALLHALGSVYWSVGLLDDSSPLLEEALALRRRLGSASDVAETLVMVASLRGAQGRYRDAEAAVTEAQRLVGPDAPAHDRLALEIKHTVGDLQRDRGDLLGAERTMSEVLAIERATGRPGSALLQSIVGCGDIAKELGKLDVAEQLLLEALELCGRLHTKPHPDRLVVIGALAGLYTERREFAKSEPLLAEALTLARTLYERNAPARATILDRLASLAARRGDMPGAEAHYKEALDGLEKAGNGQHPHFLQLLAAYAVLLTQEGRIDEAEPLLRRSLAIRKQLGLREQPALASDQAALAQVLTMRGSYAEAGELHKKSMPVLEKAYGARSKLFAASLQTFAVWQSATGDLAGAEESFRKAVAIARERYPADDPELALVVENLGYLLSETDQLAEAELLLREATAVLRKAFTLPAPRLVSALGHQASCLAKLERFPEAEKLLLECVEARVPALPGVPTVREQLVELYEKWGKPGLAEKYR